LDENKSSVTQRSYRFKLSLRTIAVAVTIIFIPVLIFIGILPFLFDIANDSLAIVICMIIGFGFAAFLIYGCVFLLTHKIFIDDEWLIVSYIKKKRKINLNEISCFRYINRIGLLLYLSGKTDAIKIYSDIENFDEIYNWVNQRFNDCDLMELQKDKDELLKGKESEFEKQDALEWVGIARNYSYMLNITGLISGIWLFSFSVYRDVAIIFNIMIPLIAYISVLLSNGLINFNQNLNSIRASVNMAFLIPSTALTFGLYNKQRILYGFDSWLVLSILAVLMSVILLVRSKEYKKSKSLIPITLVAIGYYLYGAILQLKVIF